MDDIYIIIGVYIALIIGVLSYGSYYLSTIPPNPMYISSKLFPIIVNTSTYKPSQAPYTVYIFNGIDQVNDTECISNVQLTHYVFNYTTQKYQMVWSEAITDPTQVYSTYNKLKNVFPIASPSGYAPLCPSVTENG
jgi:hypothetical protein